MDSAVATIPIIDTDTHVAEPPDLWTSRVSRRWGDKVPHVRWDEAWQDEAWFVGDTRLTPVGTFAMAGWSEYPPLHPPRLYDTDPSIWDAKARLALMDEYGIHAQALYPNVALFDAESLVDMQDRDLQLACVRAYNDYVTEFSSIAPERYLPMSTLPFWELDATLVEMERCASMGHRGIVFSQEPALFGLPALNNRHWDPMWAAAQEMQLPVNFHIAVGDMSIVKGADPEHGKHANFASAGVTFFLGNARTMAQLIFSGVCHRFPELNFVSVESGVGWIPSALAAMDWQYINSGVHKEHPEWELLPSEYFRRQIYGCFWFEAEPARFAIESFADSVLYETDFPHPTCMAPGPATSAVTPWQYLDRTFSDVPEATMRKVLFENAAKLYNVEAPKATVAT